MCWATWSAEKFFNILTVLGISSIAAPAGVGMAKAALEFDVQVMIAVAGACFPVFFHGYKIGRISGFFFLTFHMAYAVYLILGGIGGAVFAGYRQVMVFYMAPATTVVLAILMVSAFLKRKNPA
jgi:cation:H+ antiporter